MPHHSRPGLWFAPPVNFGNSPYLWPIPGRSAFAFNTLINLVEDYRSIVICTWVHPDFDPQRPRWKWAGSKPSSWNRRRSAGAKDGLVFLVESRRSNTVAESHGLHSYHANWIEAFPFVRSTAIPQTEKEALGTNRILNPLQAKEFLWRRSLRRTLPGRRHSDEWSFQRSAQRNHPNARNPIKFYIYLCTAKFIYL